MPIKFIVFFILSIVVFTIFSMIYHWGIGFSGTGSGEALFFYLPGSLSASVIPAVSSGLLFTTFDYRRKAFGIIVILILVAVVFGVLYGSLSFSNVLKQPGTGEVFQPFLSEKIHNLDDSLVYVESAEDDGRLGGIVLRRKDDASPAFNYIENARLSDSRPQFIAGAGGEVLKIYPENPVFSGVFTPARLFGGYLSDLAYCNGIYRRAAAEGGLRFILLTAGLTLFLVVCLLFKGLSAWPLFEMILILFLHRLAYFLIMLFSTEADFISETFLGGTAVPEPALVSVGALTAVLLIAGILLRTSARLRKA